MVRFAPACLRGFTDQPLRGLNGTGTKTRKTGVDRVHEMAALIGQHMCLPHNHHTFALETSVSDRGAAALDRPVKDDPYVLKYATCLVDSMHITTLCSRRWHDSSQKYGDGSAITTCSQFSLLPLGQPFAYCAALTVAASASCPSFLRNALNPQRSGADM